MSGGGGRSKDRPPTPTILNHSIREIQNRVGLVELREMTMWSCAAVVLGVSCGLVAGDPFGTKSSYFSVAETNDTALEVAGCEPRLLWVLAR